MLMEAPEVVLATIRPLVDSLYGIFEHAVADAQNYLEAKTAELRGTNGDQTIDPFVFSQLVRFYAAEILGSSRAAELGYRFERLPNCGIFLEYEGYQIRIWKADEGKLPAPGYSQAKQDFYQQPLFADVLPAKLALLWESYRNGQVVLILACPHGDGNPWETGQSHWHVTVPHPATRRRGTAASSTDDFDDLGFKGDQGTGKDGDD
jgi:hypothetical protein